MTQHPRFDDRGWAVVPVDRYMKAIGHERERLQGGKLEATVEDDTWHGFMGEEIADFVLAYYGLEVVMDGGINGAPDLIAAGTRLDVKTQTIHTGEFQPRYTHSVFDYLLPGLPDGLLFCVYEVPDERLVVTGAIGARRFEEVAKPIPQGGKMLSGQTASRDLHVIPAAALTPARDFIHARQNRGGQHGSNGE